jgi:hypothetical protein
MYILNVHVYNKYLLLVVDDVDDVSVENDSGGSHCKQRHKKTKLINKSITSQRKQHAHSHPKVASVTVTATHSIRQIYTWIRHYLALLCYYAERGRGDPPGGAHYECDLSPLLLVLRRMYSSGAEGYDTIASSDDSYADNEGDNSNTHIIGNESSSIDCGGIYLQYDILSNIDIIYIVNVYF